MSRHRSIFRDPTLTSLTALSAVALILLVGSGAGAQSVTSMSGLFGNNPQVENAAQAAEEAIKGIATNTESWRGASGAIASLATSTDTLFCAGWIISFRDTYLERARAAAINASAEELLALQKLRELLDVVITECDKVLSDPPPEPPEPQDDDFQPAGDTWTPCEEACKERYEYRDRMRYEYVVAEHRYREAGRNTGLAEDLEKREGDHELHATSLEHAIADELARHEEMIEALERYERAKELLEACLFRCLEASKQHTTWWQSPITYGVAGAAAVGVGVGLGSGDSGTPGTGTNPPGPGAAGDAAGIGATVQSCGGSYRVLFNVDADVSNHREFVGMPSSMTLNVLVASIHIEGPSPFVAVDGDIANDGSFRATGMGTVAGFENVMVEMTGTLTGCHAASGTLSALYRMGINGGLPGGQPISYRINGTK